MKMLRNIALAFLMACNFLQVFPAQIDELTAQDKAMRFLHQKNTSLLRSAPTLALTYSCKDNAAQLRSTNNRVFYYVYNVGNEQGFVIVSGDDATKSILGYSDKGRFSTENMPANLSDWLNFYQAEIRFAMDNGLNTDTTSIIRMRSASSVAPLLESIKWNQDEPYNILCPAASGVRSVTGCVATAMAQVMRFYRWPVSGTGSHSYKSDVYGTLSADFSKTSYNWSNMPETYGSTSTGTQDTAVATLMYHCGISVDMNFNTATNGGSATSFLSTCKALTTYFGYDPDLQLHTRSLFNTNDWENLIRSELESARPVLYAGVSSGGGHAFVCDGYDNYGLYHINWGWGGISNGYFELSALNPSSAGIGGTVGGFSQSQQIITNIRKPDGISNAFYELGMYSKGLTPSAVSLANTSNGKLGLSFGFVNYDYRSFAGKVGLGLYKDGIFLKELASDAVSVDSYRGLMLTYNTISLSGIAAGSYQIFSMLKPTGSQTWAPVKDNNMLNNHLNVVISGSTTLSATIAMPPMSPTLSLTQTIQQAGNVYQNKTANFSMTVQNTGKEFYSNLGVRLISKINPAVYQDTYFGAVCIPAGETKTFSFGGNVSSAPGSYYAVAVFDSTNAFSNTGFKPLGTPSGWLPVTVQAEPSAASLSLTQKIVLSKATVYRNEPITLNASISNAGGVYDAEISAFVFPANWGNSVGYLDPKTTTIETNETKLLTLTGSLDLEPGDYHFVLFSQTSGNWVQMTPQTSGMLDFTLLQSSASDIVSENTPDLSIFPNPVKDRLNIRTSGTIRQVRVTDLWGKLYPSTCEANVVRVENLAPGLYLLRIVTETGSQTVKFIKE